MRVFRSRRVRRLFPAGVASAFIAAVVLAAMSFGPNLSSLVLGTLILGSLGSLALFLLLKIAVEPRLRASSRR